ncbi:tRNA-(ms[2]io[6]A)-hydroxylase [Jiulongibacter sediminis]|uniref:tRNA hydroxylase n=1 Tax=Jiulongibacter sediminis TaxID=1605367 RepID=A0A0P7BRJ4_9BACT|nr:tRNA-(ms[2]io[6]A)-hydroxylase [Jiulongibacter sediminis]KPM49925.1 tRNA hydroxylase [Jiulongibacter sediminis]TBX26961.1 tRNA hydroxylase [Jiulongibacter sediminis]
MADYLTTLGLKLPSDPRWVDIAKMNLADILIDHAFCEQKAASSCISLIVKYPEKQKLIEVMTPVVTEEWGHFQRVLKEMDKRGIQLTKARKDEYVAALHKCGKKGGSREEQLMEDVLICAMIEARSAERFKLLSEEISDEKLKKFYFELMVSEAGHYKNFIELAEEYNPKEKVQKRWQELLRQEAEIMKNLEVRPDRFH